MIYRLTAFVATALAFFAAAAPGFAQAPAGPRAAVSSGTPIATPTHPLTLAEAVAMAVGNNSGVVGARQRLQKAQELVEQVKAQGRPQIGANALDVVSTYHTYPPVLSLTGVSNPVLPGGGAIPTVVDAGASFSGAFIGSGSGGGISVAGGSVTPGIASTSAGGGTATPGTAAPGNRESPGGGATPGSPAPGATAPSGGSSSGEGVNSTVALLPAIIADYVTQTRSISSPSPSPSLVSLEKSMPSASELESQLASASPAAATAASQSGSQRSSSQSNATAASTSTGPSYNPRTNNYLGRVDVTQYLDVFGLLSAARAAQQSVRDFYSYDITRLQNETALAAKNLFFNVLLTQAQVDTEQEQVNYAQEDVRIAQDRFAQGIVSNFDVLTAQTALSTAQQQLIAAQDERDLAQASLAYLLGTNPDGTLTLVDPALPPLNAPVDLPKSTSIAVTNRPEMLQAAANIQEAKRLVKIAGEGLIPAIGLVGSASGTSEASASTPDNYAEIALEVSVALDNGGATRSKVRSAKVDVQAQELAYLQTKTSIGLEVRQSAVNIRNAQAQVASATTGVAQAQEALRLAKERYAAGLGQFIDVLNALAQLAVTRTNLSTAQYFYQSSLAQLVRAMGGR